LTILCRLITNKESDKEWITRQHLADLLYNKFLISIPMVFDMLVAYGRENHLVLGKFLEALFKIEPKYMNDLKLALQFVQQVIFFKIHIYLSLFIHESLSVRLVVCEFAKGVQAIKAILNLYTVLGLLSHGRNANSRSIHHFKI
jgi:hypothetical protein